MESTTGSKATCKFWICFLQSRINIRPRTTADPVNISAIAREIKCANTVGEEKHFEIRNDLESSR